MTPEICERTDLDIDAIVKERSELLNIDQSKWVHWVIEKIERRLVWLNNKLAEDHPIVKELCNAADVG